MGRITLFGFLHYDKTLFDDIELPEGIDKDNLIDTIMMESGDLYPYYQQPVYLKRNINNWFKRMLPNFERMVKALTEEYNPLHNYDRYEESNDSRVENNRFTSDKNTNSSLNNSFDNSGTNNRNVSAYNSGGYQPSNQDVSNNNGSSFSSGADSENIETTNTVDDNNTHTAHLYGNIGVTTSATMAREELELRKYDLVLEIAREFERRFITQVY